MKYIYIYINNMYGSQQYKYMFLIKTIELLCRNKYIVALITEG